MEQPDAFYAGELALPTKLRTTPIVPVHHSSTVQRRRPMLGEALVQSGLLTERQLAELLAHQAQTPIVSRLRLGELVVAREMATEDDIARNLAVILGLDFVDPRRERVAPDALRRLPIEYAMASVCIPLSCGHTWLRLAVADPTDHEAVHAVREVTGVMSISLAVATSTAIREALEIGWSDPFLIAGNAADEFAAGAAEDTEDAPVEPAPRPLSAAAARKAKRARVQDTPAHWEYQFIGDALPYGKPGHVDTEHISARLNELGAGGWEAVGIANDGVRVRVLLKRSAG